MDLYNSIKENSRAGFIEVLILELLSERTMYGYEIGQELSDRSKGVFIQKEGALYGPLYRMEARGLISSFKQVDNDKYKKFYNITAKGREYLSFAKKEIFVVYDSVLSILKKESTKDDKATQETSQSLHEETEQLTET